MKNSIIITGDFKEKYLPTTIACCINQSIKPYEIILIYNNLNNENLLKKKFTKKIKFIKTKEKIKNPVQDQLNKIKIASKHCKGEIILFCDGDDFFCKNKIKIINTNFNNLNGILLHNFKIKKKNKLYSISNRLYKNNFFFKKFFNSWPDKITTSAIVISKRNLDNFFNKHKIINYQFLAIDALLAIFYLKKIKFLKEILMIKNEDDGNRVDLNYIKNLKNYIKRRIEQHEYFSVIHNERKKIEYFILKIINYCRLF